MCACSKSEIRYEGTLFAIDTKDSTVTLQNGASLAGGAALCVPRAKAGARRRRANEAQMRTPLCPVPALEGAQVTLLVLRRVPWRRSVRRHLSPLRASIPGSSCAWKIRE